MKINIKIGLTLLAAAFIFSGCLIKRDAPVEQVSPEQVSPKQAPPKQVSPEQALPEQTSPESVTPVKSIGDDTSVTRAFAAKMIALAFNDASSIDSFDDEIEFSDVSDDAWYHKYVNAVFVNGYMLGDDDKFSPDASITLSQAYTLMEKLGGPRPSVQDENAQKPVSYALWMDLYKKTLEAQSGDRTIKEAFGVNEKTLIVLATPADNSKLREGGFIADDGAYTCAGIDMSPYLDAEIRVLEKEGEIMAVLSVETFSPTIKNAYMVNNDADHVTIFSGGVERSYHHSSDMPDATGKICDVTIDGGAAVKIELLGEKTREAAMLTTLSEIELKQSGALSVDERFKIYSVENGAPKWKTISALPIGREAADFILKDGVARAAVIYDSSATSVIRVAISQKGGGLSHKNVSISSAGGFTVSNGAETSRRAPGETLDISEETFGDGVRVYITPENDGGLELNGAKYRGVFEVSKREGGYYVVNELDMERYLYSVVTSEMPSSYGVEALKAQAVAARSYARNQMSVNRFHAYGAQVDDTVSSQVYNKTPESDASVQAVEETKGQYLTVNGAPVSANFFSTSCGMTANSGEVWADGATKRFPTKTQTFLSATRQYDGADFGDLSVEENAERFFKATNVSSPDSEFPWFRWRADMTAKEIGASINSALKQRYEANPTLIKTLQANGAFRSRPVESVGELVDIEVTARGEAGNIMAMRVTGSERSILILTEYNVRALIKPEQNLDGGRAITTVKADGSVSENYSLMPSAFYSMDKARDENGNLISVTFYGGGNGHGVGMSQNGVKSMADSGKTFKEILRHYFTGTEVMKL
ncbi:MAG: SpoIID/LytB domain-containing protein [Clostridiales bacterium]|jgi:stage II sporulation protein D|nr:SpoIID/LytB domain-containing protein [Clostridiales bacterium]